MNVLKSATAFLMVSLMTGLPAEAGPKHCPPGHAKKGWCSPGSYHELPPGIRMQIFDRWKEAGLRRPGRGESYVIIDNEILLIIDATREVLEAIGAVSRVLN